MSSTPAAPQPDVSGLQDLMNLEQDIGKDQNVLSLLSFYRSRIGEFESERQEWIKRVGVTEVSHAELHRVKWELRVRQEEICELQNALSDANVQLFEEREEALKLLAENDQLKIQQTEDRRRIQHLLALTEPVSQEVTYFKDCRPYLMTRKLHSSQQQQHQDPPSDEQANSSSSSDPRIRVVPNDKLQMSTSCSSGVAGSSKVLRTIYLPNEQTDSLAFRVKSLESQLKEQSKISKDRIDALEKDRVERESLYRKDKEALNKHIEALEQKLDHAEKSARAATKDYLEIRHSSQQKERELAENSTLLQAENKSMRLQLNSLSEKLHAETESIRHSIAEDSDRFVSKFRRQAIEAEDNYNKLKQKHAKLATESKEKISKLNNRVAELKKKCQTIEKRRQFDFEGFNKDILEMQKQIRALELIAFDKPLVVEPSHVKSNDNFLAATHADKTSEGRMQARAALLRQEIDQLRDKLSNLDTQFLGDENSTSVNKKPTRKPKPSKPDWVQ